MSSNYGSLVGAGLSIGQALHKAFAGGSVSRGNTLEDGGLGNTRTTSQAGTRTNRLNGLSSVNDFLKFNFDNSFNLGRSSSFLQDILGQRVLSSLGGAAESTLPLAFAGLGSNLARQGRTDPRNLSGQVAQIAAGTQNAQDSIDGRLARTGMQRSGVGAALYSAVGDSGNRAVNTLQANESQMAEQRYRADIAQAINSIINPALQNQGLERGIALNVSQQRAQESSLRRSEQQTMLSGLLGLFAGNLNGGGGGGNPGAATFSGGTSNPWTGQDTSSGGF